MIGGEEAGDLTTTLVLTRHLLCLLAKPSIFLPALMNLVDGKVTIRSLINWKIYLAEGARQASFFRVWQVICLLDLLRAGNSFCSLLVI
jgi:hypothetical protein